MQKLQKNTRRRPTKREKRWKMSVVGRRNVEFAKKRSLSVDENEKEVKNGYHPWMKVKKRQKALIIRGWNAENAKNCPSSVDESEKTAKSRITKIIPDFAQTLWYQESTLTERTLNRELPTNVHTLIFQHTADVFLRVKFDSTGFNFSNNTRQMFFFVCW